jgi:hypothetical protein
MAKIKKDQSKVKGLMRILQVVSYKDGNILIRQFPKDMYVWDVFYKGNFYSSYVIVKPVKGKKKLEQSSLEELIKILYAGAAATIDFQRGDKVSKTEKELVKTFEKARKAYSQGTA